MKLDLDAWADDYAGTLYATGADDFGLVSPVDPSRHALELVEPMRWRANCTGSIATLRRVAGRSLL